MSRLGLLILPTAVIAACTSPASSTEDAPAAPASVSALTPFWTPLVPADLDGAPAGVFLLDTGAVGLYLDDALAESYTGDVADTLGWGGESWSEVSLTPYDLGTVSGLLGTEVSGILGANYLSDRVIGLDYRAGRVYPMDSWDPSLDYGEDVTSDFATSDFSFVRNHFIVATARFEGLATDQVVVLDTGTSSAAISQTLADALGVETDGRAVLRGSSAVAGSAASESEIVRLRSVSIGDREAIRTWASVVPDSSLRAVSNAIDQPVAAILGGTWLREFLVAIDYPNQQLHVSPYVNLSHIDNEFDAVGVETIRTADGVQIFTVYEGSDAEAQGIAVGDVLTTLDGEAVDGMSTSEILSYLRGEPGSSLDLGLTGAEGDYEVSVLREALLPYLD